VTDPGTRQRLAAILVADVAGYSRLMAADERQTVAALDAARSVFTAAVGAHQGRIIDMAGDSVLAVFDTATGAVTAALAVQDGLAAAAQPLPEHRRMRFRIGVHLGDVIEKADGTVYGDGVNIAARLESLAEPGGVMVSDAVRTAVRGKVAAAFVDRGEKRVKNIPEPVHAFAVRGGEGRPSAAHRLPRRLIAAGVAAVVLAVLGASVAWYAPWRARTDAAAPGGGALPLPSKPSIAVLPFENMSGEAEQAYFADGITEDLITDLSKVSGLFVIARNSTFVYKGKARDVREVARTLGVRYVLEGSVRRSGNDIRVNAQLIDASTGGHVWADRYDGDMKNIFGLQDKVSRTVVTALAVELTKDDRERVARRGTDNPQAYDAFLKGWEQYLKQNPEAFRGAITHFKQATALDPAYGRAYAALAATYWDASTRYWDVLLGFNRQHEAQYLAEQYLAKAMRDPTPLAHQVASAMNLQAQQHEEALAEAKRAIAADPNDANGYIALAAVLSFTGHPDEALVEVERAMRLNPHYPPSYLYQLALARFGLKRLDEAAASLERAIALNPDDHWSQRLLLATYGQLGRRDQGGKLLETMKTREARGRIAAWDPITIKAIAYWYPYTRREDAERFSEGLRRSGVSE